MPINSKENMVQRWSFTKSVARWPMEPIPVQLLMRGRGLWSLSEGEKKNLSSRNTQAWGHPPDHTPHIPTRTTITHPIFPHTPPCAEVSPSRWLRKSWALHSGPGRKGQFAERFWEMVAIVSMPDSEMCILSSADLVVCYRDAAF